MQEQTEKIIETFQSMIHRDLSALEFWQNFEPDNGQASITSVDDLVAKIPETLFDEEDFEKLKQTALEIMSFCQKKKILLEKISSRLKEFDGI